MGCRFAWHDRLQVVTKRIVILRRLFLNTRTFKQLKQIICTRSNSSGIGPPNFKISGSLLSVPRLPSSPPAFQPSFQPSSLPAFQPSSPPTFKRSSLPAFQPSSPPALQPSSLPAFQPSSPPTLQPGFPPSSLPAFQPAFSTFKPSSLPALQPSSPGYKYHVKEWLDG